MNNYIQNWFATILKKTLKIVLWVAGSIVLLFLLLAILLQIPTVQNFAKNRVVNYLHEKIHTKVALNKIEIGFPKKIILSGVYFQDQKKDTLLSGQKIAVDLDLFELLNNKVEINAINLSEIVANISKSKDSIFNFDYIIKSFSTTSQKKDAATSLTFTIDKITLDKVKVKYNDAVTHTNFYTDIMHFDTKIKKFDASKMNFEMQEANFDGFKIKLKQGANPTLNQVKITTKQNADSNVLKINIGALKLANLEVDYYNEKEQLTTKLAVKKMCIAFNTIDLKNQKLDIQTIEINALKGAVAIGKKLILSPKAKLALTTTTSNWGIKINKTALASMDFKYDDNTINPIKKGVDYRHLNLKQINFEANKISYSTTSSAAKITNFSVKDTSGLDIKMLKTDFFYGLNGVSLKNLYLLTPQTEIKNQIIIGYTSLNEVVKNIGQLQFNINFMKSKIGFKDILLFAPDLQSTNLFKRNANAVLRINGKINGKLSTFSIPNIELSGIGSTKIAASGTVIGLPKINETYFNLKIKNIRSGANDIAQFVPKETITTTIHLPHQFITQGTFVGTINNFNANLNLTSTSGNAIINATFDQRKKNKQKYNLKVSLDNFDLGRLINNKSLKRITAKTTITGTGFNKKTANAFIYTHILKADYNKYVYKNIKVQAKTSTGNFKLKAIANETNLAFNMISSGSFQGKYPLGKLYLNIDIADLNKLNLHAGPLKIRGELHADLQSADLDFLNGTINTSKFIVVNEKEQFVLDSINIIATATNFKNTILFKSQILNASFDGKYKLSQVTSALKNSVLKYYNNATYKKSVVQKQHISFKIDVKESDIWYQFLPKLKNLSPLIFSGRYNSVNDSITLNGSIPKLTYGANSINGALLNIESKNNALLYEVVIDGIQNTNFKLHYTSISGKIENNTIEYALQLKDLKNKERYVISGTLKTTNQNFEIALRPERLLLNYDLWNLSLDNTIRFGKNSLYVNHFELSKGENFVKIQSQAKQADAPIAINFKDFDIETVSNIVQNSTMQIGGKMNGTIILKNLQKKPLFISDILIDHFTFQKDTIGNLKIQVDNATATTYNSKIELTGFDNQLNLNGNYNPANSNINLDLNIKKLTTKSIQGFSFGTITEGTGFINGDLKIFGSAKKPMILGELTFDEVGFKVKQLNAQFKSMNDKITFVEGAIVLKNFTIKDEKDNDLTINGTIKTDNFTKLGFDLKLDAANFKATNSKAKDNQLYYGELYLDNHLTLKGTLDNPLVDGTIKINKDTKFTIVLPQSDPSISDREGIVEFIDKKQPQLFTIVTVDKDQSLSEIKGIIASVNIEIDKEAEISIIIDKANGDFLKLKGQAQLTGGIDASGKTSLTGRYEFTEGSYEMNFNLIKRKFDIKKGGYILWTGEPTTADVNITALYKSKTAPLDLVNNQLGSSTAEQRNTFKQKIPFETELKLTGELLQPIITFNIVLPDGNNDVSTAVINTTQAKLAQLREQPDELNRQVFALLLLNRFVGENPFASESGGTTASGLARESASKILSQQLNNFAGDLISGVEINFDLQTSEEYTTGQKQNKTDLNIGISKKLFNDRLKVTVGSSFGIEGEQKANQKANAIAGDVALDYQLSQDGRYKVRAYRVNKYQVALQGEVVETGVAFILTLDYNKFRELFYKKNLRKAPQKK